MHSSKWRYARWATGTVSTSLRAVFPAAGVGGGSIELGLRFDCDTPRAVIARYDAGMKLIVLPALLILSATAAAQSFNIDVGDNLIIFPVPMPTYVGAANQPGTWNASIHPYSTGLVNLDGSPSSATTASNQTSSYNHFPSTLTGEDRNLMIDIQTFGSAQIPATATWTFAGLQDGNYVVYTYAWAPENNGTPTLVSVPTSTDGPQSVGGAWAGGPHVQGTTYSVHNVTVAGGSFTLEAASQSGAGSINGFQLVFQGGGLTTSFCHGDGSATACPCGNAGAPGHGCASSVSASGARISGQGMPSISADTVVLSGTDMPNASALYFQGTTMQAGGAGTVFGDGLRCAGGSIVRLGTKTNVGGASQYPGPGDPSISVKGSIVAPGTRTYQVWYRNAAAFCSASTFNLSNGLEFAWVP